jgi:LAO/AO transport system kinase
VQTSLVERLLAGDSRAIARAVSIVADEAPGAEALLTEIHRHTGRAYLVGVTGPPGAGKSTLVDRLIVEFRKAGKTVGVIAVDPTSPFTGGAILGDRVRMQAHASDAGVFIRSMATRGELGGLARTTGDAAAVLDAAGLDLILIETVGVGQAEVAVAALADVCVLVLVPGTGDDVQAIKAGLMEIADIFVVNKADREGADRLVAAVEAALSLDDRSARSWTPPVIRTVATDGSGVADLAAAIDQFRAATAGEAFQARRRSRAVSRLECALRHRVLALAKPAEIRAAARRITELDTNPHAAASELVSRALATAMHLSAAGEPLVSGTLDHVGIAVEDASTILAFLAELLGVAAGPVEHISAQHVRVRFVAAGAVSLELIEPTSDTSPISRFLAKRGAGLHHVAFRVGDLTTTLASLRSHGVRLIDEAPRPGAGGRSVAFVHPSSAGGVLVELVGMESARENR